MTHLACDWQLELKAPIRNSGRGPTEFCKITITSGRCNLHSPNPTTLLIFDHQLPLKYKFLSLPCLLLPLKSKMGTIISHLLAKITPALQASNSDNYNCLLIILFHKKTYLNKSCRKTAIHWTDEGVILTAASTLAGDSSLGSDIMEITLIKIVSTVWIGSQRSDAFS